MQEYKLNGKSYFCFLVKKGSKNDIVIRYDQLAGIDIKRLTEMEKQGGELMRVMRDTTLDNGVNALAMYKDLLRPVPVVQTDKVKELEKSEPDLTKSDTAPVKRGRGRPRKTPK